MTTNKVMASPISSSHTLLSSSSRASVSPLSYYSVSCPKTPKFQFSTWIPQLGLSVFSPWSGLKHLGISVTPKSLNLEKNKRCKGKVVYASLFGVGAPEALVIGVVALLVFGPKGLAEVARNLGKTLRAFQPTIRELQDVSREFKSTLEREIGLDDISTSKQNPYNNINRTDTFSTPPSVTSTEDSQTVVDPNGSASPNRAYTSEEYLKITEEQLKAAAAEEQVQSPTQGGNLAEPQKQPQDTIKETASAVAPPQKPEIREANASSATSPSLTVKAEDK
ncbi:Sec-independent protein translocase protein TATB chloroplastic [Melia azedarach]|uniref:Sec-independent protein translocase protein TATB chloroplastic n=1 Tax=Melia azedarach TaxID=155640 RepID=A0ACC1X4J5_MELAZ|nr:Sec-independent protein translocase protein TATB chloroplastic [Melia azedarach]